MDKEIIVIDSDSESEETLVNPSLPPRNEHQPSSSESVGEDFEEDTSADDESTIEVEENLSPLMAPPDEISLLQQEAEMPLEALLNIINEAEASTSRPAPPPAGSAHSSARPQNTESYEESSGEVECVPTSTISEEGTGVEEDSEESGEDDDEWTVDVEEQMSPLMEAEDEIRMLQEEAEIPLEMLNEMRKPENDLLPDSTTSGTPEHQNASIESPTRKPSLLTQFYQRNCHFSSDEDDEYVPLKSINREIRVGEEFQVVMEHEEVNSVPGPSARLTDKLVWKPTNEITDEALDAYVEKAKKLFHSKGTKPSTDMEPYALHTLMHCEYDINKALSHLKKVEAGENITEFQERQMDDETDGDDDPKPKKPKQ